MLVFHAHVPPAPLRSLVDYIWTVRGRVDSPRSEMLFADVRADLILDKIGTGGFGPSGEPIAVLAGAFARPGPIHYRGFIHLLGVRFHPGAVEGALGVSAPALSNTSVPAERAFARADYGGLERILARPGGDEARLSNWLQDMASRRREPAGFRPAGVIAGLARGMTPGSLAAEWNYSPRRLQRHFSDAVGLSMRDVAGILRLRRAAGLLRSGLSTADAMLAAGYADQAHGTRAFRKLTGLTPGGFRRESLPMMDGFIARD